MPSIRPPVVLSPLARRDAWISLAIFCATLWLFWHSPITDVGDSKYTLLLTQNLLSKGSFALDGYAIPRKQTVRVGNSLLDSETYQIEYVNGHPHYYFPPGSSILSAPFVLIGDCLGYSVLDAHRAYSLTQEIKLQLAIASSLMAFLAVVFYFTARLLLPSGWSACLALGGALGTQVWSSGFPGLCGGTPGEFPCSAPCSICCSRRKPAGAVCIRSCWPRCCRGRISSGRPTASSSSASRSI